MQQLTLYGRDGAGKFALVDDDIFEQYSHLHWHVNRDSYVYRWAEHKRDVRTLILLHRVVMDAKPGERVDHIFGDKLDLRRERLRLCTNAQNIQNSGKRRVASTSPYKGVHRIGEDLWRASIMFDYQKFNLGNYPTAAEAAYIYDQVAMQLFGEYARLNLL